MGQRVGVQRASGAPTGARGNGSQSEAAGPGAGGAGAQTAASYGCHDESHMINDVRLLADATPQAMLAARTA